MEGYASSIEKTLHLTTFSNKNTLKVSYYLQMKMD